MNIEIHFKSIADEKPEEGREVLILSVDRTNIKTAYLYKPLGSEKYLWKAAEARNTFNIFDVFSYDFLIYPYWIYPNEIISINNVKMDSVNKTTRSDIIDI